MEEAPAGTVCAVTGLSRSRAGEGLGIETGIDLDKLIDAGQRISAVLGRASGSRVARARAAR